jgi:hypothetical protein
VVAAGPESDRVGAIVDEDAVDIGVVGQRIFDRPTGLCVDASDRVVDRISCSKRITDPPSAVGRADDLIELKSPFAANQGLGQSVSSVRAGSPAGRERLTSQFLLKFVLYFSL